MHAPHSMCKTRLHTHLQGSNRASRTTSDPFPPVLTNELMMRDLPNLSLSFTTSKSEWNTQLGLLRSQEHEGMSTSGVG